MPTTKKVQRAKKANTPSHPDHSALLSRINRIAGQLNGVSKMIVNRRYCPDILTQTRAIRSAVRSLENSLFEVHLQHCVKAALSSSNSSDAKQKILELTKLFRDFQ